MKQKKQLEVTIAVSAHSEENLIKKKNKYIYIYIYIYIYTCIYTRLHPRSFTYISIYRERERESYGKLNTGQLLGKTVISQSGI